MKKKNESVVLLDTYGEGGWCYADYVDDCQCNGVEPADDGSNAYWEWVSDRINMDIDDFFDNLRHCADESARRACVVTGELGLWWGKPDIAPTKFWTLEDAIRECWKGVDDVEIMLRNGVIEFVGKHHDGSNYFEIRPLTYRGAVKMDEGEEICVGNHWHTGKYPKYLW